MKREELDELHYITPIVNVASILSKGILSHQLAARFPLSPPYIMGAYVSCVQSRAKLSAIAPNLKITIDPHLFFLEVRQ